MKKEYPTYARFELEKAYKSLPKPEQKLIEDFVSYCSIGAKKNKLDDIRRSITQFRDITGKPLEKTELKDLRDYLALLNKSDREKYTKNGLKQHIKRFLKWKFKDWPTRFEDLRDIRLENAFNEKKINSGTLLKKEDIEKIMNKENDLTKKTFFITLYESGLRPIELRLLTWKQIKFDIDKDLTELNIFATKTSRARATYVKEATFYLKKMFDNKQSEYVFFSREDKNKPIAKNTATIWIQDMGKAVNMKIFPYLLRHSRATELYRLARQGKIAKDNVQAFLGHSQNISELYTHLDSSEVKKMLREQIYNFEELPMEKKHELEERLEKLEKIIKNLLEAEKNRMKN